MGKKGQSLLHKYLNDKCSREELLQLFELLKNEQPGTYDEILKQVWEELKGYPGLERTLDAKIRANVNDRIGSQKNIRLKGKMLNFPKRYLKFAATASVILLMGYVIYWYLLYHPKVYYATGYGQVKEIRLPDGSLVKLNSNSSLNFQQGWNKSEDREIWLDGEAYFEVKELSITDKRTTPSTEENNFIEKEASKSRFIVHTDNFDVTVLGTQFDVTDRGNHARVVLTSGQVNLNYLPANNTILMNPGDLAEVTSDRKLITRPVNTHLYTSWKENKLVFNDTPLSSIAMLIYQNYGLEVKFANPEISGRIFTATIPTRDVEVLLKILEESMKLKINRRGDQVTIAPNDEIKN